MNFNNIKFNAHPEEYFMLFLGGGRLQKENNYCSLGFDLRPDFVNRLGIKPKGKSRNEYFSTTPTHPYHNKSICSITRNLLKENGKTYSSQEDILKIACARIKYTSVMAIDLDVHNSIEIAKKLINDLGCDPLAIEVGKLNNHVHLYLQYDKPIYELDRDIIHNKLKSYNIDKPEIFNITDSKLALFGHNDYQPVDKYFNPISLKQAIIDGLLFKINGKTPVRRDVLRAIEHMDNPKPKKTFIKEKKVNNIKLLKGQRVNSFFKKYNDNTPPASIIANQIRAQFPNITLSEFADKMIQEQINLCFDSNGLTKDLKDKDKNYSKLVNECSSYYNSYQPELNPFLSSNGYKENDLSFYDNTRLLDQDLKNVISEIITLETLNEKGNRTGQWIKNFKEGRKISWEWTIGSMIYNISSKNENSYSPKISRHLNSLISEHFNIQNKVNLEPHFNHVHNKIINDVQNIYRKDFKCKVSFDDFSRKETYSFTENISKNINDIIHIFYSFLISYLSKIKNNYINTNKTTREERNKYIQRTIKIKNDIDYSLFDEVIEHNKIFKPPRDPVLVHTEEEINELCNLLD